MNDVTRQELEAQIVARAWKDEAFRRRLMADPKGAYAEEVVRQGVRQDFPEDVDVKVIEEAPNTIYLVLPTNPDASVELTDEQLATVAGGQVCGRTTTTLSECSGTFKWTCGWPCVIRDQ
jgi:hypothetical protein